MSASSTPAQLSYKIHVVGARRTELRDLYHALLKIPWWAALAVIAGCYLALNALFALLYLWVGGVANAAPGSFLDAFFFSVQTMGTIGYGAMYPATRAANAVVVGESLCGLVVTALATGLVFVRFSLTRGRLVFSHCAAIGPMNGVPTLQIRIGNDRNNQIFDAQIRLMLMISTVTEEGMRFYRNTDLPLLRSHAPALSRSWSVLHAIDAQSPLHGQTPESLEKMEAELTVTVSGTDETSLQTVYGRRTYEAREVSWGARLADVLSDLPNGDLQLDVRKFHELTPTAPIPGFPYPPPKA